MHKHYFKLNNRLVALTSFTIHTGTSCRLVVHYRETYSCFTTYNAVESHKRGKWGRV